MENISENLVMWVGYFFLIVLRISAIFTVSPVFGRRNIPNIAKIGLSILISYIIIGVYPLSDNLSYNNLVQYVIMCIKEISVGLIMGLITTVFFSTVHTAGQMIDMQIGYSIANMFDSNSSAQVPLIGGFLQVVLMLCFFIADGHILLINLISDTFRLIPVGGAVIRPQVALTFAEIFVMSFGIAIRIAIPVLGASLFTEALLGILMRAVPQMNFFVVGFPIKIGLGLLMLILFVPVFVNLSNSIFETMMDAIKKTFEGLVA